MLAVANTGSCIGPQNKVGHPVGCQFPCRKLAEYKQAPKRVCFFLVLRSEILDRIWDVVWEKKTCGIMTCGMNDLEID